MDTLAIALFLAALNKGLVDWLCAPIKKRWSDVDYWWLVYVALVTGFLIGWVAQVNVFTVYISNLLVGRILTALLIGTGSSLLHDLFDNKGN